jgi:hypothetical protein
MSENYDLSPVEKLYRSQTKLRNFRLRWGIMGFLRKFWTVKSNLEIVWKEVFQTDIVTAGGTS